MDVERRFKEMSKVSAVHALCRLSAGPCCHILCLDPAQRWQRGTGRAVKAFVGVLRGLNYGAQAPGDVRPCAQIAHLSVQQVPGVGVWVVQLHLAATQDTGSPSLLPHPQELDAADSLMGQHSPALPKRMRATLFGRLGMQHTSSMSQFRLPVSAGALPITLHRRFRSLCRGGLLLSFPLSPFSLKGTCNLSLPAAGPRGAELGGLQGQGGRRAAQQLPGGLPV